MKRFAALLFLKIFLFSALFAQQDQVQLKVSVPQNNGGMMLGGWGNIVFEVENNSNSVISISEATGVWNAGGERYNNWKEKKQVKVQPNKNGRFIVTTHMPSKTKELAGNSTPYVSGEVAYSVNGKEFRAPYKVNIAIAKLSSPLELKSGKLVGVELQTATWAKVNNPEKIVKYLDEVYKHMQDLTSNTPYNGDLMVILEAPENPYFAYAGNPIILNTKFVLESVKTFDNDLVTYGWVHEMGHDFDNNIGQWYNYGKFTEFQANIKLSYVIEQMCKKNSVLKIRSWIDKKSDLNGVEFNDELFAPKSKAYLASDRSWETMKSDDFHSLFHGVIREKGWKVMKKFYKTYVKLAKSDMKAPNGLERLELALSVFNKCAGGGLEDLYAQYRIPLDNEKMEKILSKYGI